MEDPTYVEYFSKVLFGASKVKKDPSPPPKVQLKTEGQEPEYKSKINSKIQYECFARCPSKSRQETQHSKINLNRSMSIKADLEFE